MRVTVYETPRSNQVSKGKAGCVDVLLRVKKHKRKKKKKHKPTIRPEQGRYITAIL